MQKRWFWGMIGLVWATAVLVGWPSLSVVQAQDGTQLWLGEPDSSNFPTVTLTIRSAGPDGTPLSEDELTNLRLRENGVPISDFDLRFVPVGMDAIFVLDANDTFAQTNETTGQTAVDVTRELFARYSNRFMNPSGVDKVSVIVPNASNRNGRFLVENETNGDLLQEAVNEYTPALPEETPVQAMLEMAIDQAASQTENGRYQAIFLLTEAWDLSQQLEYETLVTQAQEAGVPIFVGIMGPVATLEELGNAGALASPTGGIHTHIPTADDGDTVFLRWQQQGNQPQISYQSFLRESGTYPIAINVGQAAANTELTLELDSPEVSIVLEEPVVRRVGAAEDTPLSDLQPTVQPVPVQVVWPDGLQRELTEVSFRVNNTLQPIARLPQPDENGRFVLEWLVQNNGVGAYELNVAIEDSLGYTATSDPLIVTIAVDRPKPPTPTPMPTPTPKPVDQVTKLTSLPQNTLLIALASVALLGLVLVMIRAIRRYRESVMIREARQARRAAAERRRATEAAMAAPPDEPKVPLQLTLIPLGSKPESNIVMEGENVTLGRDETAVTYTLPDRSVSPLHARIRKRNGRYWLYDEGSENGTQLNHTLLGLSPKQLTDGDEIQMGQVRLRVQLAPYPDETETAEEEKNQKEAEEASVPDEPNETNAASADKLDEESDTPTIDDDTAEDS